MRSTYMVPAGSTDAVKPAQSLVDRATALQSSLTIGDPTGQAPTLPAVVVLSDQLAPAFIADDTGQATLAQVQAAQQAAATAEQTAANNVATIRANIVAHQTQIQNWMTANPNGAILTAAQTLVLAKWLDGLCQLLLQQYSTTSQT